jgi:plastocyanin
MWSCGGGGSSPAAPSDPTPPPAASGANVTVNISGSSGSKSFDPNPVPATVGQTVAFKNNTNTAHHIVLDDGSADLGTLAPGATSQMFTVKSGSRNFHCTNHPSMVGSVNGPVPDAPPCAAGPGYC